MKNRKTYLNKITLTILSFAILSSSILMSSCSKNKTKTLNITMSLGEEEWKVLREQIFPIFETKHNIKINSYQVEAEHLATKIEALQLSEKSEIDLFAQDNMSLASLVNKNLVYDLSDLEENISEEVLKNLVESCKFNNKLLFMPFRPNVQIVYYNKNTFDKYNIPLPKNWDQLYNAAKLFYKNEGAGKVLIKGFGGNPTATQIYELITQAGGDPYSFNDEGCKKTFEFLKKLSPYLSPESKRAKWDTTNEILAKQEAYIGQNWPFAVNILIKNYGLDFIKTYSGWSGPKKESHVIGGDVFGIPKNSKNKALAIEFIFFMQSKEVQEILTSKLGWPSIRSDSYSKVPEWQIPHFKAVNEALSKGIFRKNVTWWPEYKKYVNLAFQDIVYNSANIEQTLDKYKLILEKNK